MPSGVSCAVDTVHKGVSSNASTQLRPNDVDGFVPFRLRERIDPDPRSMPARTRWCEPSRAIHTVAGLALLAPGSSILTELAGMVPVIWWSKFRLSLRYLALGGFVTPDSSCVAPAAGSSTREVDSSKSSEIAPVVRTDFTEIFVAQRETGHPARRCRCIRLCRGGLARTSALVIQ